MKMPESSHVSMRGRPRRWTVHTTTTVIETVAAAASSSGTGDTVPLATVGPKPRHASLPTQSMVLIEYNSACTRTTGRASTRKRQRETPATRAAVPATRPAGAVPRVRAQTAVRRTVRDSAPMGE